LSKSSKSQAHQFFKGRLGVVIKKILFEKTQTMATMGNTEKGEN